MDTPHTKWHFVKPWDRHGLILLTAGISYILLGITYSLSEVTQSRRDHLELMIDIMPFELWTKGFFVVGVISIISSRWPSKPRTLGYATLTGWTSLWSGFYIIGGLTEPMGEAYISVGLAWATMAFLWWAISGLISPPKERGDREYLASPHRDHLGSIDLRPGGIRDPEIVGESESEKPH